MLALCWPLLDLCGAYVAPMFAYVSRMLPQVGPMLALRGPYVGPCRPYVGLSWPYLAPMLALWWPMLVLCWPKLTLCCPMLTLCWLQLPLSCPYVDPMFTYVGLGNALPHSPIAVTEKAEVGTGWERGRPTRSAAGAARLYNLRLPTEGLRQGHGLWLLAGARIKG